MNGLERNWSGKKDKVLRKVKLNKKNNKRESVWMKNTYMSAGFLPSAMHEDMEASNFYIYDNVTKKLEDTIKVYPKLNKEVVNFERKLRNKSGDNQDEYKFLAKHFPTFWSMLFILYNREFEVLYEHDKVTIFGLVSYDTVNDQLCFENVYSMY